MEHFFTTVPGIIAAVGATIGGMIGGVLFLINIYSQQKRKIKIEDTVDEDRLIDILQTTVDELEKKVNKQNIDLENLTKEVSKLRSENKTLIEILQGRDKQTQQFYEEGFKAMREATEILVIARDIQSTVKDKNESVNQLIKVVNENAKVILEAAKL
jgi:hypothetical protein